MPFLRIWRRARDYSGRPALHPYGAALRAFKFAPGKFVEPKGSHQILTIPIFLGMAFAIPKNMAESEGFEPSIRFPVYTLSRGAPSATRPALLNSNCYPVTSFILASTWRTCALLRGYEIRPVFRPSGRTACVQIRSLRICPALRPSGHQHKTLMFKIAPGDFASHSASSPDKQLLGPRF